VRPARDEAAASRRRPAREESGGDRHALYLECDGASLGNPGASGIGICLSDAEGSTVAEHSEPIGRATNNVAEYTALIRGLELAAARGAHRVAVRMDSELVVRQVLGVYKTRDAKMQDLLAVVKTRLRAFESWTIEAVGRGMNARADALAKAGAERAREKGG
jgi:ribonuclease HI